MHKENHIAKGCAKLKFPFVHMMLSSGCVFLSNCEVEHGCPISVSDQEGDSSSQRNTGSSSGVDFSFCGTDFLVTQEELDLVLDSGGHQTVCSVPKDNAVSSQQLMEGEGAFQNLDWLPVRYAACQGWVDSSKLRCPNDGEKPTWVYIPVPYHSQLLETDSTRWNPSITCLATALTMILDYYYFESDVNVINALVDDIEPDEGGYDPTCLTNPVCTSAASAVKVAEGYCSTVTAGDNWSREDLIASLENGNPVFALVTSGLKPDSYAHAITIIGYIDDGETIMYHDPADDGDNPNDKGNSTATWDELAASWAGPNDVGDPMQPEGHTYFGLACDQPFTK